MNTVEIYHLRPGARRAHAGDRLGKGNAEIVKQGYGFAYTRFPFERMKKFRGYQREAREHGSGLWGEE